MMIGISEKLRSICEKVVAQDLSESEWEEVESSDMFQTEQFCGGYNADERAFCFSYYESSGVEYWFQITLEEIKGILQKEIKELEVVEAV